MPDKAKSRQDYQVLYESRLQGDRTRAVASILAGLISIAAGVVALRQLRKA